MEFENKKIKNDLIILTSGPEVKINKGARPMLYEVIFINPEGKKLNYYSPFPSMLIKKNI